jgi:hypothetical protein
MISVVVSRHVFHNQLIIGPHCPCLIRVYYKLNMIFFDDIYYCEYLSNLSQYAFDN